MTCRTTWVLALLVAVPTFAPAQSLGEAAQKEQRRRDRVRREGASTRPLTEDDLAAAKGTFANDPARPLGSGSGPGAAPASEGAAAGGGLLEVEEGGPARSREAHWRGRAERARGRIAEAERRYEALQLMIRFGQPALYDENGKRLMYSVHQLKRKADQAAAELAAARQAFEDLLDDGRRAGALPGWFR